MQKFVGKFKDWIVKILEGVIISLLVSEFQNLLNDRGLYMSNVASWLIAGSSGAVGVMLLEWFGVNDKILNRKTKTSINDNDEFISLQEAIYILEKEGPVQGRLENSPDPEYDYLMHLLTLTKENGVLLYGDTPFNKEQVSFKIIIQNAVQKRIKGEKDYLSDLKTKTGVPISNISIKRKQFNQVLKNFTSN